MQQEEALTSRALILHSSVAFLCHRGMARTIMCAGVGQDCFDRSCLLQEKLRFPSGTATAKVIRMLHGGAALDEVDEPPRACTLPVVGEVRDS